MTDPHVELARARIRYLSAFVRGELVESELKKRLWMIDRTEKRLAKTEERLAKARDANRNWHQRRKLENALLRSLAQQGYAP